MSQGESPKHLIKGQPWWVWTIERLGFPVFVACAMGYAGWKVFEWGGENVAKPIVQKHVEFLDAVMKSQEATVDVQKQTAKAQEQTAETIQQQADTLEGVSKVVKEVSETQKSIDTSLRMILESSQVN